MPNWTRRPIQINGELGVCHLVVRSEAPPGHLESDERLREVALEFRQELNDIISSATRATLGDEFAVTDLDLERGSLQIYVTLGTLYAVYMGFSRYESFIKSLSMLGSQLATLVFRFFSAREGPGITVKWSWQPGPALTVAEEVRRLSMAGDRDSVLLYYLISSHAVLLTALLWLIFKHLR